MDHLASSHREEDETTLFTEENEDERALMEDKDEAASMEGKEGESDSDEEVDELELEFAAQENQPSESEALGMKKNRVIYRYRTENHFLEAMRATKPIAGFVEDIPGPDGTVEPAFKVVYWASKSTFVAQQVMFLDRNGSYRHSLWCSKIKPGKKDEATSEWNQVQSRARLAAIAIPNKCSVGEESTDYNKYCVLTNWWKNREKDGEYRLPRLDPGLYGCRKQKGKVPMGNVVNDVNTNPGVMITI